MEYLWSANLSIRNLSKNKNSRGAIHNICSNMFEVCCGIIFLLYTFHKSVYVLQIGNLKDHYHFFHSRTIKRSTLSSRGRHSFISMEPKVRPLYCFCCALIWYWRWSESADLWWTSSICGFPRHNVGICSSLWWWNPSKKSLDWIPCTAKQPSSSLTKSNYCSFSHFHPKF